MKLIFVYGPPAVGKLTIAKELAKQTGFVLFHNHLTADIGRLLFNFGDPRLFSLSERLRLDVFEAAAQSDTEGMIFTLVYITDDRDFVSKVVETITKNGGQVLFVQLKCDHTELFKRVTNESRKSHRKLTDPEELKKSLVKWDLAVSVEHTPNITIDTTHTEPTDVAQKIMSEYNLPITHENE